MTKQQWKFVNHVCRFVDSQCFPDFVLNKNIAKLFIKFQGEGRLALTQPELDSIKPLIFAQQNKEIKIKGCIEDVFYFWSFGGGWYIPLIMDIQLEFASRHNHKDYIFIRAVIKIARSMKKDIIKFLENYSVFSDKQKERILLDRESVLAKSERSRR